MTFFDRSASSGYIEILSRKELVTDLL